MKTCPRCEQSKSIDAFYKNAGWCKSCQKEYNKAYYNRGYWKDKKILYNQSPIAKQKQVENQLRRNYGINLEEWTNIFNSQDGRCRICQTHQSELKVKLCVDHCHSTGKVRGLLCDNCNKGLGNFRDSGEFLLRAIEYLKEK